MTVTSTPWSCIRNRGLVWLEQKFSGPGEPTGNIGGSNEAASNAGAGHGRPDVGVPVLYDGEDVKHMRKDLKGSYPRAPGQTNGKSSLEHQKGTILKIVKLSV